MDFNELKEMKVGEVKAVSNGLMILRVPGGWIYQMFESYNGTITTSTFVPEPRGEIKIDMDLSEVINAIYDAIQELKN